MAVIRTLDNKLINITNSEGQKLWQILNGELEVGSKNIAVNGIDITNIKMVYLSAINAPESYIEKYPEVTLRFLARTRKITKEGCETGKYNLYCQPLLDLYKRAYKVGIVNDLMPVREP